MMLQIDKDGKVISPKVRLTFLYKGKNTSSISPLIQQGKMKGLPTGIIVHQTNSPTATSTLNGYQSKLSDNRKPDGAHFLIDKDGTIWQTAPVNQKAAHVGKLKSRCYYEATCSPDEKKLLKKWNPTATHKREMKKEFPLRFPSNEDSLGIELVGQAFKIKGSDGKRIKKNGQDVEIYEPLTDNQKASLRWLIREIAETLEVPLTEVYRHPTVSEKNETEAESAEDVISELQAESNREVSSEAIQ
jgi:N-acetyl-anhydromuramyl-L-alanine amidase AmpD